MTVSVLLAGDRPPIQGGLAPYLSTMDDLDVVATVPTGAGAVAAAVRHRPMVLVIDPLLEGHTGLTTIRQVLRVTPGTAALVLTSREDDAMVLAAVNAGARGFLVKQRPDLGTVQAIRGMAAGEAIFGASIAGRIGELFATTSPTRFPFHDLTSREREILELLCAGMSNSAIAHRLRLTPKTINNRLSGIFGKLQVGSRAEAIARATEYSAY
jgi:DNA-binding NarL/FixJ family response regulator